MTQDRLVELQNEAMRLSQQDLTNDVNTILESLIEEVEEEVHTSVWKKIVACMDEGCFSDEEWYWLLDNVKPESYG